MHTFNPNLLGTNSSTVEDYDPYKRCRPKCDRCGCFVQGKIEKRAYTYSDPIYNDNWDLVGTMDHTVVEYYMYCGHCNSYTALD